MNRGFFRWLVSVLAVPAGLAGCLFFTSHWALWLGLGLSLIPLMAGAALPLIERKRSQAFRELERAQLLIQMRMADLNAVAHGLEAGQHGGLGDKLRQQLEERISIEIAHRRALEVMLDSSEKESSEKPTRVPAWSLLRVTQALMDVFGSKKYREEMIGDLTEEHGRIAQEHGAWWARAYLARQCLGLLWPLITRLVRLVIAVLGLDWLRKLSG